MATQGAGFEAVLDVEWSGGIATGATVDYVFVGADDTDVDDATYYAIDNNLAPVLSESWGGCEAGTSRRPPQAGGIQRGRPEPHRHLRLRGERARHHLCRSRWRRRRDRAASTHSVRASPGSTSTIPAAYPGVTAVGGTELPATSLQNGGNGPFTSYVGGLETTWNEANNPNSFSGALGAGGGGISVIFGRPPTRARSPLAPSWVALPSPLVRPAGMRQVPDVSFTAAASNNPLFLECTQDPNTDDCSGTGGYPTLSAGGGTSFSTPAFAGVVALMNQAAGGRLGNVNPLLYGLQTTTPTAFHDITTGNNEIVCASGTDPGCPATDHYGFTAAPGYDCATGLGSMDVTVALNAIAGRAPTATTLALAPTTTTEGSPVTLTATIDTVETDAGADAIGGLVTFGFQSYDDSSPPQIDLSWTLGAGVVTGTAAEGTATLSVAVPPGLIKPGQQSVDVVAIYGGDGAHLPSTSPRVNLSFGALSFAVAPAAPTVDVGGIVRFTSTGGVSPVKWYIADDSTCGDAGSDAATCAAVDEPTGTFYAGPEVGATVVRAIDAAGAEATVTVTVIAPRPPVIPGGAAMAGRAGSSPADGSDAEDDGCSFGPRGRRGEAWGVIGAVVAGLMVRRRSRRRR